MPNRRILLFWIGHADLGEMIPTLPEHLQERLYAEIKGLKRYKRPVKSTNSILPFIEQGKFDEIHLLSNYPKWVGELYGEYIGRNVQVCEFQVDPNNSQDFFDATDTHISQINTRSTAEWPAECHFFLNPSSPTTMKAFIQLGTKLRATYWKKSEKDVLEEYIPSDSLGHFPPEATQNQLLADDEIEEFKTILGTSDAVRNVKNQIRRVANHDCPVLLLGERGTGKELFATAIHQISHRKEKSFGAINCAGLTETLLESELFGHEKGAFTGATEKKDGIFKQTDSGTLFLDEIGESSPALQAKLLRVLQPPQGKPQSFRSFKSVGGTKEIVCDVRVISGTNRKLSSKTFRPDLRDRLGFRILLPPLREREGDVLFLAMEFLAQFNKENKEKKEFSQATKKFIETYNWPGNVRQLQNIIEQAAISSEKLIIEETDIKEAIGYKEPKQTPTLEYTVGGGISLEDYLDKLKRKYIKEALQQKNGNVADAARLLGYGERAQTFRNQMEALGIRPENFKK